MAMDTDTTNSKVVSPIFQVVCIFISILFISFAFYLGLSTLHIREEPPPIKIVTPETIQRFGGTPQQIETGLYIHNFQSFNLVENIFVFFGVVWFLFNPGTISLDTLATFDFDSGTILEKSNPKITVLDEKKMFVQFLIHARIGSNLDYTYFPVDDHRIFFILNLPLVSPDHILFTSSQRDFIVEPDMTVFGWQQIDTNVETGYSESVMDLYDERKTLRYPSVVYSIDYVRYGGRYLLTILFPLLLIFYLTLFCFSLGAMRSRLSVSVGSITAILAYRFVIENLSPNTGYFMLSDYLFFIFLIAIFLIFFLVIIDQFAVRILQFYKKISIVVLHLTIIGFIYYFFVFW